MTSGRERWTPEESQAWQASRPWIVGCNFIPGTAVNQLEMWQVGTFDLDTIERELGWARGIGFNAIRVFLHDLLWKDDALGLCARIDRFLDAAARHGISTMLVLFDGVWDPFPKLGPQRAPRPHVHNSGWVQSPGVEVLGDPSRHTQLAEYVQGIVGRFRDDSRVLAWDLFNEPDNPNIGTYGGNEPGDKPELAAALLARTFEWARAAGPSQPLTAGVWRGPVRGEGVSEINRLMLAKSDVISFHSYFGAAHVANRIRELGDFGRPLLLTEYLARGAGSEFEAVLPLLKERNVGAFNWGLVSGKTQTIYPWTSWAHTDDAEPAPWFHDIFRPDGTPYREEEVALIRRLTGV